jgi:hypothetical protein
MAFPILVGHNRWHCIDGGAMNDIQFYQTERVPGNLTRPKDTLYCDIIDQLKHIAEINEQLQEDKTTGNVFCSTSAVIAQQDILTHLQRLHATLGSP